MIWGLPIFSALILALSFERPYMGLLSFFGLIPFLFFLAKIKSHKQAFLGGWLMGGLFFALIFRWILYAYPPDWAGVHNSYVAIPLFLFVWLGVSVFVGIAAGFFGYFSLPFIQRRAGLLIIPSFFILSEYIRAWLFMFLSWAPEARLGAHWSFGNLGYTMIDIPAIYWSRIVGLYGLSFFVALVNFIIFSFFHSRKNFQLKNLTFSAAFILFLFFPFVISVPEKGETLKAALVHMDNSQGILGVYNFTELWRQVEKNKDFHQPDLIVFPEASRFFAFLTDEEKQFIKRIFPDENRPGLIITSNIYAAEGNLKERKEQMIYRDQKGGLIAVQDKSFLMPLGEYFPIIVKSVIQFLNPIPVQHFNYLRSMQPALIPESPINFNNIKIGGLLCSGVVSPLLYRSLADDGAEVFINSASQIIFKNRPFFVLQMKTMARFQAIANARPFLQAANGGQAFFIDADGKVAAETEGTENKIIIFDFSPSAKKTIFTRFGDWPLAAAFLMVLGVLTANFIKRNKKRDSV